MARNLFEGIESGGVGELGNAPWATRSPFRPEPDRDLMLVPRVHDWFADPATREALGQIAADPAVAAVHEHEHGVDVRLADDWIEARGEPLEAGVVPDANADLAAGERYAVYFWGANTTKALHIGHLRNLALGNAIAAALRSRRCSGRVPQPDLRHRPQHGRGDGWDRRLRPRRRRARLRKRREERPLRRPLLRRLRLLRPRRARATTALRTRSLGRRLSTRTRPTS